MQKTAVTIAALAAAGTAVAVAYGCMRPSAKQQLRQDIKSTAKDVENVKNEMMNVGQDVTEMAQNLKKQF